ncbi:MAG: FAD-dependent oxidoreductase [Gemmatimonadaceae bacterium]
MTRRDAEVLVVGAGPAGAATAFFLARAGLDVLVLDRARFPRDKPCAEYLSPQASRILHEMDALTAVESAGAAHLTGMRLRAPNGTVIHGEFAAAHGFRGFRDRGLALRRLVLDDLLLARARAMGARVMEQAMVRDLEYDGHGRVLGVVVGTHSGTRTLRAPLVIGADGLRSVVGRRLGLTRSGRFPRRVALVSHFTGVLGMGACGEMHVDAAGYLGLADVGGGTTNVALVIPVRDATSLHGALDAFLARWIADRPHLATRFRDASPLANARATGPFNSHARRAWAPGAALVGDAADFFDPFTGEGIYAALRGAELLTGYAFDAARATGAARHDVALAAYDRCRRHEFRGKRRVERAIARTVSSPALFNRVAAVLAARPDMADLLVGVAGDFVPPREVLRPGFLLRLLLAPAGTLPPDSRATGAAAGRA